MPARASRGIPVAEVLLGEEADAEYAEALAWYADRSARAADGFEAAFAGVIASIGEDPGRFAECDRPGFRFAVLRKYPYSAIYRMVGEAVQIVALAHSRREPGYWSRRV